MPGDRPRFRRDRPAADPQAVGLAALLVIAALLVVARALWAPDPPGGRLVTVDGEVPRPGTYLVDPPTVGAAVAAAGGAVDDDREVPDGYAVHLHGGVAEILLPADPLLVALPVDVNRHGADALDAIPGVSRKVAQAIVEDRERRGPFYEERDLLRVRGIGPSTLEKIAPFITVGEPGPRPPPRKVDLNRATAAELEALPGIGPVTAARIVVDREERGPYRSVDELQRVRGIGPATVERLRQRVEVR